MRKKDHNMETQRKTKYVGIEEKLKMNRKVFIFSEICEEIVFVINCRRKGSQDPRYFSFLVIKFMIFKRHPWWSSH